MASAAILATHSSVSTTSGGTAATAATGTGASQRRATLDGEDNQDLLVTGNGPGPDEDHEEELGAGGSSDEDDTLVGASASAGYHARQRRRKQMKLKRARGPLGGYGNARALRPGSRAFKYCFFSTPFSQVASYFKRDGFEDFLVFDKHRTAVKQFTFTQMTDNGGFQFLSLDNKHMMLWEDAARLVKSVPFPHGQERFLQSATFVPYAQVFLAAALDMTFKVYDKHLNLLQSIPHSDRAITSICYNPFRRLVVCGGVQGLSSWKLEEHFTPQATVYHMRRKFVFPGMDQWVSSFDIDRKSSRIFVYVENSVYVFDAQTAALVTVLRRAHTAHVTNCIWYLRSQYYVTGGLGGQIRVWAQHHTHKAGEHESIGVKATRQEQRELREQQDMQSLTDESAEVRKKQTHALLHIFETHAAAITGLELHSIPGLAVSASLDGTIRVLNLEALTELFVLNLPEPITAMHLFHAHGTLLLGSALSSGVITVWKLKSVCTFFALCVGQVQVLRRCDPLSDRFGHSDGNGMLIVDAGEDVRVFTQTGALVSRMPPKAVIDGIRKFVFSAAQELLFSLSDDGSLCVFSTREPQCKLLHVMSDPAPGVDDKSGCLCLIDRKPLKAVRLAGLGDEEIPNFRGYVDHGTEEILLAGSHGGNVLFLDTRRAGAMLCSVQMHTSQLSWLGYRKHAGIIASLGVDEHLGLQLKLWKLPALVMLMQISLAKIGMPTCVALSELYPYIGVGREDGSVTIIRYRETVGSGMAASATTNSSEGEDESGEVGEDEAGVRDDEDGMNAGSDVADDDPDDIDTDEGAHVSDDDEIGDDNYGRADGSLDGEDNEGQEERPDASRSFRRQSHRHQSGHHHHHHHHHHNHSRRHHHHHRHRHRRGGRNRSPRRTTQKLSEVWGNSSSLFAFVDPTVAIEPHSQAVTEMRWNDDERVLATCSLDCSVRCWNFNGDPVRIICFHQPVCSIDFLTPSNDMIVSQSAYLLRVANSSWRPPEGTCIGPDELTEQQKREQEAEAKARMLGLLPRALLDPESTEASGHKGGNAGGPEAESLVSTKPRKVPQTGPVRDSLYVRLVTKRKQRPGQGAPAAITNATDGNENSSPHLAPRPPTSERGASASAETGHAGGRAGATVAAAIAAAAAAAAGTNDNNRVEDSELAGPSISDLGSVGAVTIATNANAPLPDKEADTRDAMATSQPQPEKQKKAPLISVRDAPVRVNAARRVIGSMQDEFNVEESRLAEEMREANRKREMELRKLAISLRMQRWRVQTPNGGDQQQLPYTQLPQAPQHRLLVHQNTLSASANEASPRLYSRPHYTSAALAGPDEALPGLPSGAHLHGTHHHHHHHRRNHRHHDHSHGHGGHPHHHGQQQQQPHRAGRHGALHMAEQLHAQEQSSALVQGRHPQDSIGPQVVHDPRQSGNFGGAQTPQGEHAGAAAAIVERSKALAKRLIGMHGMGSFGLNV